MRWPVPTKAFLKTSLCLYRVVILTMKSNQVTTVNKVVMDEVFRYRENLFQRDAHQGDNGKKVVGARRVFLRRRWENARLNQIRKEIEGLSAVASMPALRPSDSTWLLPELGTGRITHVELPLRRAFAVHASKLARPRNWYWDCSSGFSMCTPGTSGRSRTSCTHNCCSAPYTPCP